MSGIWQEFVERLGLTVRQMMLLRAPDKIIGDDYDPYMLRWHIIPKNPFFNIYAHSFMKSDDDRALHDHPWIFNISILLQGEYTEHTIKQGGVHHKTVRKAGDIRIRGPWSAHRIELTNDLCKTLFITGPMIREWGFHCPKGWRPWRKFTDETGNRVGRGCD